MDDDLICEKCHAPFTYPGRGRPPKKCSSCRAGRQRGSNSLEGHLHQSVGRLRKDHMLRVPCWCGSKLVLVSRRLDDMGLTKSCGGSTCSVDGKDPADV